MEKGETKGESEGESQRQAPAQGEGLEGERGRKIKG